MASEVIAFSVNLRRNQNKYNAAYGKYYPEADSETPTVYTYDYLVDNVIVPSYYGLPYTYTYWMTEDEKGFETKFIEFHSANPIVPKGYRLQYERSS